MYASWPVRIVLLKKNNLCIYNMISNKRFAISVIMFVIVYASLSVSEVLLNGPEYTLQGGTVNLECRIKNLSTKSAIDNAVIKRDTGIPGEPLLRTLATKNGKHLDAPKNADVSVSTLVDGTLRILLTLTDVTRDDAAEYTCTAGRQLPSGYTTLGSKTLRLAIWYPPAPNYPTCSVAPSKPTDKNLERQVNDVVQLSCTSEFANPHISLIWGRTGDGNIPDHIEFLQSTAIRSEISVTLTEQDNGAYFICIGKSPAFPKYTANCVIGPFKLSETDRSSPTTESINTTFLAQWETEPTKCNSSLVGFFVDMKSPYVIGGIAGVGLIVLIAFLIVFICCFIFCCQCCCKRRQKLQEEDESDTPKDINLVMTTSDAGSKENFTKKNENDPQAPPPKYSTLAGCASAETTFMVKPEEQPETQSTSKKQTEVKKRPKKEYPPPPSYPRPMKGLSLKISDREAQRIQDAVVYGNLKGDGTTNREDSNPYSNINRVKRNRPKSTPITRSATPSPTRHLKEPFKSELANGLLIIGANAEGTVPYSNLTVSKKGVRPSPTLNRPNKAPPPPPSQDGQSSYDELEIGSVTS